MLASRSISSRPVAVQRNCVAAFQPARIVSSTTVYSGCKLQWSGLSLSSWLSQAPVVARRPLVCQAAADVIDAEAVAVPKGGIAHLRFKRGSVHKVWVGASRSMALSSRN